MWRLLVVGEVAPDGTLTKLSTEVATLARSLAEAAGIEVSGVVHGADADAAAGELARFVPEVQIDRRLEGVASATTIAAALSTMVDVGDVVLLGASPNGRDVAGTLCGLVGMAVLANAVGARWTDDGPVVEVNAFGGKLITESAFTREGGVITVRPNAVTAEPLATSGAIKDVAPSEIPATHEVRVVERVDEASAAVSIDDARIIVAGGRGVGGPDGFKLIEDLAEALGGAVGATRAAVDSGWIPYGQQIGQTGKIVKPQLYLALGISGAIQHKVGMQTSETIVAINRDPDSPIADFADLFVVGDLFEVGPALLAELRSRPG
ncbi:MAG: electron transfer flavoprotein subunit alpha/FixB family protein [Actinomycetota bacterium]